MKEESWNLLNASATSGKWHSAFKSLSDEFSKETTIVVVSLNPTADEVLPETGLEIVKARGYTDLYQLFLYTQIGELGEFPEIFETDSITERQLWNFHDIGRRANHFVFAVRSVPDAETRKVIALRWKRVRSEISYVNPEAKFFRFGDPFQDSTPKNFSKFSAADDLIAI